VFDVDIGSRNLMAAEADPAPLIRRSLRQSKIDRRTVQIHSRTVEPRVDRAGDLDVVLVKE
jgi:hypothetical protein